ncbi:MAG: hypothetical protein L6R41_001492 [Letrouitia leprolyta]|nr:MAG: hypothetical protein L6R41_001492 [Letrouitia leprolyta]
MLHAAHVRTGRFTSPHLIDRWDCITIDEKSVDENVFRKAEGAIRDRDVTGNIGASEFELLTATAFEIFAQEKIDVGVIEVGLGGQYDATNVIKRPIVTVITKIGKDHQALLGDTIEEISFQKAGIMKRGTPCVVDATNSPTVLKVLEWFAQENGAGPLIHVPTDIREEIGALQPVFFEKNLEHHQRTNLSLAYSASNIVLQQRGLISHLPALLQGAKEAFWPGRLQSLDIAVLTGRRDPALIDGAHNTQSAEVLRSFVNKNIRNKPHPVTWVISVSEGKKLWEILPLLFHPEDNVVAVEFGKVDGMPWVSPISPPVILDVARQLGISGSLYNAGQNIISSLQFADRTAAADPIVICGSLYLVSDVLRLLRDTKRSEVGG